MKNRKQIHLVLNDRGNFVQAAVIDKGKLILDYENDETKDVRVRAAVPIKEELIEGAKYWVKKDDRWKSVDDYIDFYIYCREREIFEQIQEIRKCVKRITRIAMCETNARKALKDYHSRIS